MAATLLHGCGSLESPYETVPGRPAHSSNLPNHDQNVRGLNQSAPHPSKPQSSEVELKKDRELVELARTGNQPAFRSLIERHQGRAYAIALGLVRDEQNAREIVQEAFLRVHRGLDRFNGSSSFFTWLYRIVTNLSIDLMRKPLRRETPFEEGMESSLDRFPALLAQLPDAQPFEAIRRQEIALRVQQALDELPAYHRAAIVMRELDGLSYEEMACAMNVSKGTVMSRLYHARQKLQRALASFYSEQIDGRLVEARDA